MQDDKLSDRNYILNKIDFFDCSILESTSLSLKKDREFILQAISKNGDALKYADEIFKKDREIVLRVVSQNGYALLFADETLKKDREIVLKAVSQYGFALEYADEALKKDREIVLRAVSQNGYALLLGDETCKKDREIVLKAVSQNGNVLEYADKIFKKDREIVLRAVSQNGNVLEYADTSLKDDMIFIYLLSKQNISLCRSFSPQLTKIIEDGKPEKLVKDIIGSYSKQFNSENELYYCVKISEFEPSKPKNVSVFNFNPTYSVQFIEKLIIYEIFKRLYEIEPRTDFIGESVNYYFFCFRLDRFLEENNIQPTSVKDLRKTIENISNKFDITHYSKSEINYIMYFYTKWTENETIFNDYRNILTKYNELHGNSSKIFHALIRYYKYFKADYNFFSILGVGGEGVVFKGLQRNSNTLVAIKFKFETEESEESANEIINLLKRSDMNGKIKYLDCGMIERHLYSVMELGEESLLNFIQSNEKVYNNLPKMMTREKLIEILQIFIKVLGSVQSIHDHNVLHRDLDPQNIMKIGNEYKIIDFETSKVVKTGNSITITRGKYAYMSPEVSHDNYTDEMLKSDNDFKLAHNDGNITIKCDIFSLGCILLKLLTNCPLQLDDYYMNDSDLSKYNDNYTYFTGYGKYFYTVTTTSEGEMKLHYAIEKLINKSINEAYGINKILIRCLITMIQRDSSKRLDCYSYKTTLENAIKILRREIELSDMENDIKKYKEITPLIPYSQLYDERNSLIEKVKKLEEENRNLKLLIK